MPSRSPLATLALRLEHCWELYSWLRRLVELSRWRSNRPHLSWIPPPLQNDTSNATKSSWWSGWHLWREILSPSNECLCLPNALRPSCPQSSTCLRWAYLQDALEANAQTVRIPVVIPSRQSVGGKFLLGQSRRPNLCADELGKHLKEKVKNTKQVLTNFKKI